MAPSHTHTSVQTNKDTSEMFIALFAQACIKHIHIYYMEYTASGSHRKSMPIYTYLSEGYQLAEIWDAGKMESEMMPRRESRSEHVAAVKRLEAIVY